MTVLKEHPTGFLLRALAEVTACRAVADERPPAGRLRERDLARDLYRASSAYEAE